MLRNEHRRSNIIISFVFHLCDCNSRTSSSSIQYFRHGTMSIGPAWLEAGVYCSPFQWKVTGLFSASIHHWATLTQEVQLLVHNVSQCRSTVSTFSIFVIAVKSRVIHAGIVPSLEHRYCIYLLSHIPVRWSLSCALSWVQDLPGTDTELASAERRRGRRWFTKFRTLLIHWPNKELQWTKWWLTVLMSE